MSETRQQSEKKKHALGPVDDFPVGECQIMQVGRRSIGVYHLEDGSFLAVRNSCPHHGAPICLGTRTGTMLPSEPGTYRSGMPGQILRCPWHGWEFELASGRTLFGIDKARLVTYPVAVEDGEVVIEAKGL